MICHASDTKVVTVGASWRWSPQIGRKVMQSSISCTVAVDVCFDVLWRFLRFDDLNRVTPQCFISIYRKTSRAWRKIISSVVRRMICDKHWNALASILAVSLIWAGAVVRKLRDATTSSAIFKGRKDVQCVRKGWSTFISSKRINILKNPLTVLLYRIIHISKHQSDNFFKWHFLYRVTF